MNTSEGLESAAYRYIHSELVWEIYSCIGGLVAQNNVAEMCSNEW